MKADSARLPNGRGKRSLLLDREGGGKMAVPVRCENLTKTFGVTRAVEDVSLDIEPGELFFLLGPSGCGKTTLLRCVAGFHRPDRGRVFIGDEDISDLPPYRRDTGMVFQGYALWPHMTVRANVAFGLRMRRLPRHEIARRVDEALTLVKMGDLAERKPNALSGGQQQRVALARALVVQPRCLLLDEPLSNLDAKLRLEMRGEIRRICREAGLTAIYVTHDQKEALSIADRLAVMHEGRIAQIGTPSDVYRRPASKFTAEFIGETNFVDGCVVEAEGTRLVLNTPIGRLACEGDAVSVEPGTPVTLSIRPEVVRLGSEAAAENRFTGAVHHTVYLGETARHRVTLPSDGGGEVTLHAFELNPKTVARDAAEACDVWIDPRDIVVLRQ